MVFLGFVESLHDLGSHIRGGNAETSDELAEVRTADAGVSREGIVGEIPSGQMLLDG